MKIEERNSFEKNTTIKFSLECYACTSTIVRSYEFNSNLEKIYEDFLSEAKKIGWKYGKSSINKKYAVRCPFCHSKRNDKGWHSNNYLYAC